MSKLPRWHREIAAESDDLWFVGLEASRLHVLAPPAVALCRRAEPCHGTRDLPGGWRWAIWPRQNEEHWPAIDEEPPGTVREIDTAAVLILIDVELHELVWACLWSQLQIARRIGQQGLGRVPAEDLARASALSAAWLKRELVRAFPERAALLEAGDWQCEWDLEFRVDLTELIRPRCQRVIDSHYSAPSGSLRALARWLTVKLNAGEQVCVEGQHIWHAGELLDGACQTTRDPGDHSEFGWRESSCVIEIDPTTEEMLFP